MLKINPKFKVVPKPQVQEIQDGFATQEMQDIPLNGFDTQPTVSGQGLDELVAKMKTIRLKKPKAERKKKITF